MHFDFEFHLTNNFHSDALSKMSDNARNFGLETVPGKQPLVVYVKNWCKFVQRVL
jgi:hypothetical protein